MMRKLGIRDGAENGSIRPIDDHRALAVLTLIISQGILTMPAALARALGAEDVGPEVLRRLTGPALELFTHGVYADDSVIRRATNAWAAAPPEPAHQERNSRMAIHRGHPEATEGAHPHRRGAGGPPLCRGDAVASRGEVHDQAPILTEPARRGHRGPTLEAWPGGCGDAGWWLSS